MTHQLTLRCIFRNEECTADFPSAAVVEVDTRKQSHPDLAGVVAAVR